MDQVCLTSVVESNVESTELLIYKLKRWHPCPMLCIHYFHQRPWVFCSLHPWRRQPWRSKLSSCHPAPWLRVSCGSLPHAHCSVRHHNTTEKSNLNLVLPANRFASRPQNTTWTMSFEMALIIMYISVKSHLSFILICPTLDLCWTKAQTVASPIPLEPPVTTATYDISHVNCNTDFLFRRPLPTFPLRSR